jgi:hypothetical protein
VFSTVAAWGLRPSAAAAQEMRPILGVTTSLKEMDRRLNQAFADAILDRSPAIAAGRDGSIEDVPALAAAVRYDVPGLFADYARETGVALLSRSVPISDVSRRFEDLWESVAREVRGVDEGQIERFRTVTGTEVANLSDSLDVLRDAPPIDPAGAAFLEAVLAGDLDEGGRILRKAAFAGVSTEQIYLSLVQPSLVEV